MINYLADISIHYSRLSGSFTATFAAPNKVSLR